MSEEQGIKTKQFLLRLNDDTLYIEDKRETRNIRRRGKRQ
jgi:hypothetical protein